MFRQSQGNFFFFREGHSATFLKVILMSPIEIQNVFLMINFDVWHRLGHVRTIFDIVGLWKSIFHWQICEDFVWKWADLSVCKDFISDSLIKALKTLKSAHFDTNSSQICEWKIDFHNQTMSKMVQTCPNRSQTSKLIIRNTFWTSVSDIRITLKKGAETPSLKKKFPYDIYSKNKSDQKLVSDRFLIFWSTFSEQVLPKSDLKVV